MPKKTLSKPVPIPTPETMVQMGEKFKLPYYLNPDLWATKAEWNAISPFIDIPKTCEKIAESVVQSFNKLSVSFWDIRTGQVGTYETPLTSKNLRHFAQPQKKKLLQIGNKMGSL